MATDLPHFVVHALPGDYAADLAGVLADIGGGKDRGAPLPLNEAANFMATQSKGQLCLIYLDPVRVICEAVADKIDIVEALDTWAKSARRALTLHRRNRQRCTLFEAGHLHRYAAAGLARLGIDDDKATALLGATTDTSPPPEPLQYILAQAVLTEHAEANLAAQELDASTQVLSNDPTVTPAAMALEAYEALQHKIDEVAELPVLRSERDRLQEDLATLQTNFEAHITETEALKERLATADQTAQHAADLQMELDVKTAHAELLVEQNTAMIADMEDLEAEVDTAKERLKVAQSKLQTVQAEGEITKSELTASQASNATIMAERDARAAELRDTKTQMDALSHQLSERDTELASARDHIDAIMNSRSMRLTKPLRGFAKLFRGSGNA